MLIMTLSHARETGDNSLITNYVRPLPPVPALYSGIHMLCSTSFSTNGRSTSSRTRSSPRTRSARTTSRARSRTRPTSRSRASSASARWARWPASRGRARRALTIPCVNRRSLRLLHELSDLSCCTVQSIAQDYVTKWQGFATSSDGSHLTLAVSAFVIVKWLAGFDVGAIVRQRLQVGTNSVLYY